MRAAARLRMSRNSDGQRPSVHRLRRRPPTQRPTGRTSRSHPAPTPRERGGTRRNRQRRPPGSKRVVPAQGDAPGLTRGGGSGDHGTRGAARRPRELSSGRRRGRESTPEGTGGVGIGSGGRARARRPPEGPRAPGSRPRTPFPSPRRTLGSPLAWRSWETGASLSPQTRDARRRSAPKDDLQRCRNRQMRARRAVTGTRRRRARCLGRMAPPSVPARPVDPPRGAGHLLATRGRRGHACPVATLGEGSVAHRR